MVPATVRKWGDVRPNALTCFGAGPYHRPTMQRYYWFFGTSGRPGAEAV